MSNTVSIDNQYLIDLAKEYVINEQDNDYKEQIQDLMNSNNTEALKKLLLPRISFGTSGLRAVMGSGYTKINMTTIKQTTQGVIKYLESLNAEKNRGVVIGFDQRLKSSLFAKSVKELFLQNGFKVYFIEKVCITPMVPFGVTFFKCLCGIMITASHNPKEYNGYKLYWENGCQIKEPIDEQITRFIYNNLKIEKTTTNHTYEQCYNVLFENYFQKIAAYKQEMRIASKTTDVAFVYTPLHGAGGVFAEKVFEVFGLPKFHKVQSQFHHNPDFPTVKFPNPEESGALDLAIETANEKEAQIILSNDPDADRFSMAEKINGKWRIYTGNEIGAILGAYVFRKYKSKSPENAKNVYMITSCVSSKFIDHMARKEGFNSVSTLTGFKWIGSKASELEKDPNITVLFGFEESIGYMLGNVVHDKDGIITLGVAATMITEIYAEKQTVSDYLTSLYDKYGYFINNNGYYICTDPLIINKIFSEIRGVDVINSEYSMSDLKYPIVLDGIKLNRVRDLTACYDSLEKSQHISTKLPCSKSTQMITFEFQNPSNEIIELTLRTSGTEPKIKFYSEMIVSKPNVVVKDIEKELSRVIDCILELLLKPHEHNLKKITMR